MTIREDAAQIIRESIKEVLPGKSVERALAQIPIPETGRLIVISVGKAGFSMARAAAQILGDRIDEGLVVTKYEHASKKLNRFTCIEAGHPLPDENSVKGAEAAMQLVENLTPDDFVLFMVSGGASALFEKPAISIEEMNSITNLLLRSGADIQEMNTVRKHLSKVKGGRFAKLCEPARVETVILSDVLGNNPSVIGSGPTYPDFTSGEEAFAIIEKYRIRVSADALKALTDETPKQLTNSRIHIIGDLSYLCEAAKKEAEKLGYHPLILTKDLTCEAKEAGAFFGAIAKTYQHSERPVALIAGGETIVHVNGNGTGGRNQEMALSCSAYLDGMKNVCFFSVGSDGTDGPTDAAGGIVDGNTVSRLRQNGRTVYQSLLNNDSYPALKEANNLIITGPTGTNVNDLSVLLIRPEVR